MELAGSHLADPPEPLDREGMQEGKFLVRRNDEQTVRLGHTARDLGEELRPRHAHGDRKPDLLAHGGAEATGDLGRRAGDARKPATSRNASSTDIGSTSGVVCSNTSNTARLASAYADILGSTTMASGHSRRAWAPPIAVLTPKARAS